MRLVRFVRPYRLWNRGETAGFEDAEADRLIAQGIAVDPDQAARAEADAKAKAEADAKAGKA